MIKQTKNRLAIVIPAYKRKYFIETLESFKQQTNKEFTLYIGDDNSPEDLWEIVKNYTSNINIVYKRFDTNWGGKDLVSHWNRCLDLVQEEEWIWLFSDDDCIDTNCVEEFYKALLKYPDKSLFHFPVKVINSENIEVDSYKSFKNFEENMSSSKFFEHKIKGEIQSYVVEYIFDRRLINLYGKFVNFDLAWCSDDATWIQYGHLTGITTVPTAYVRWRFSGINISSISGDKFVVERKLNSKLQYIQWVISFFKYLPVDKLVVIKWLFVDLEGNTSFSIGSKIKYAYKYSKLLFGSFVAFFVSIFMLQKEIRISLSTLKKQNVFVGK